MLGKAIFEANSNVIVFDVDAIVAFNESKSGNTETTVIYIPGMPGSIIIDFPFTDFLDIYTRYKRGAIQTSDFVLDESEQPVHGVIRFYSPEEEAEVNGAEVDPGPGFGGFNDFFGGG